MKKTLLTGFIVLGLITLISCGQTETASPKPPPDNAQQMQSPIIPHLITDAEVGIKTKCPVMGTEITVTKDTLASEYKGKVYYFCCGGCPEEFKKNPEKYAQK